MKMMNSKKIQLAVLAVCAGFLSSCGSMSQFQPGAGNKYQYSYTLISPVESQRLIFRDDSIIVQFKFDDAAIQFQLQNISSSNCLLDWEKASIGIKGGYYGVRHASNFYSDTIRSHSIVLPPLGYVRDVVVPQNNIYYDGRKWVEVDLLPTTDHRSLPARDAIKKNVGQKISLLLPVTFGKAAKIYKFDFQVDAVKQIAWKDFIPIKRVPAPPKVNRAAWDNVTAAVIVVGVLGFSAYALSIKKLPPSE